MAPRPLHKHWADIETAISDIILLGQRAEVEAAEQFAVRISADPEGAELGPLLRELRASLRRELALDPTPMPRHYNLRFHVGPGPRPNARNRKNTR